MQVLVIALTVGIMVSEYVAAMNVLQGNRQVKEAVTAVIAEVHRLRQPADITGQAVPVYHVQAVLPRTTCAQAVPHHVAVHTAVQVREAVRVDKRR